MEIRQLVNIEDKGDGRFIANFRLEQRDAIPVTLDDLRVNMDHFNNDIEKIDGSILEANGRIELINTEILDLTEQRDVLSKSATLLNEFFVTRPVVQTEPEEEVTTEEVDTPVIEQADEVILN